MLFSEVYSSYFNVVAEILKKAIDGDLKNSDINEIITQKAFGESILNIPNALKNEDWKLLNSNFETPLLNYPSMPLTDLQRQWLKAISLDPRIKLFDPNFDGLENVEPLYEQGAVVYFDRYADGDDFENPKYIENFQTILKAFRESRKLSVRFMGGKGKEFSAICIPQKLEYSSKDDKFRLISIVKTKNRNEKLIINLSRITKVDLIGEFNQGDYSLPAPKLRELVLELKDERNCLERFMLHFSHLEKEAEKIDETHYEIKLIYDHDDETEILIRLLSFGPMIKVISPKRMVEQIKERIQKQISCEA